METEEKASINEATFVNTNNLLKDNIKPEYNIPCLERAEESLSLEELIDLTSPDLREITFHSDGRVIAKTGGRAKNPKKLYGSKTSKNLGGLPNSQKAKEVLIKLLKDNLT